VSSESGASSSRPSVLRLRFALGRTFPCPGEPAAVWPVFRDIARWYEEYEWLVVDGPSYEEAGGLAEGQTVEVRHGNRIDEHGRGPLEALPALFVTEMLKVRDHEIVSALAGETDDWKHYTQFYVWRLVPAGDQTGVRIESYTEMDLRHPMGGVELTEYEDALVGNWSASWETALEGLGRVVAGAG
jgi:hypothetical protein